MLNKKGVTSVELLVCFIIVATIVVSMYNLRGNSVRFNYGAFS